MKHKISIIGGDLRMVKLAKNLAKDEHIVYVYGMEKSHELEENNIEIVETLDQALEKGEYIIGPLPFSGNGVSINAPFSNKEIKIEELKKMQKDKIFIAGAIKEEIKEMLEKYHKEVIDVMQREDFVVLNALATAEGTIQVAMENTEDAIHGSNILVLGFGRVAKMVAYKFLSLGAEVTCAARKAEDFAWIEAYGYKAIDINNMHEKLEDFDIIVNTVPVQILNKKELEFIRKDTLIIDLASNPGGVDRDEVKKQNLKFVWALALPGKVAPNTSAKFIKNTIYNVINEY